MTTLPCPRQLPVFGSNVDIMRIMSTLEADEITSCTQVKHFNWIGTWPRSIVFTKRETLVGDLQAKCTELVKQEPYGIVSCLNDKYKMWNNSGRVEKTPFVIVCMLASKVRRQLEAIYKTPIDDSDDAIFRAALISWLGMGECADITPEIAAHWRKRQYGQA